MNVEPFIQALVDQWPELRRRKCHVQATARTAADWRGTEFQLFDPYSGTQLRFCVDDCLLFSVRDESRLIDHLGNAVRGFAIIVLGHDAVREWEHYAAGLNGLRRMMDVVAAALTLQAGAADRPPVDAARS